jgi:predicted type IV restriction endonuclease
MDKQKLIEEIEQLIGRRKAMSPESTEADVTSNLVEPLIALLGWDVYTPTQYSRQKYVRGAGYADITLLIGEPVIFVEVKKFGKIPTNRIGPQPQALLPFKEFRDLIDRTPEEKQAMKYARSKGIKWAVLTNFDCLYVFNADREQIILSFTNTSEYIKKIDDLTASKRKDRSEES